MGKTFILGGKLNLGFKRPSLWDRQTKVRAKKTLNFIDEAKGDILDVGGANELGRWVAKELDLNYYATNCDLDYDFDVNKKYDTMFCFEVLEHLFNPLFCLNNMVKYLKDDGIIYISIPKRLPHFLCGKNHFHEFDKQRFEYLLENAGLRIVKQSKFNSRYDWGFYFTGIRPILRLLFFKPISRIYKCVKY